MISRFLQLPHVIQAVQLLQAIVNKGPGAVLIRVDLTFTVIGPATGAIDQSLMA